MVGCASLVKAVLTSIAIYHITPLDIPGEVMQFIDKIRRVFLWVDIYKVLGNKCKLIWEVNGFLIDLGGLGVLHLGKSAHALQLWWLWHEWVASRKRWVGIGNPCDDEDVARSHA